MIRVYYLGVIRENNTDTIQGISLIHHALILTTKGPATRKLIMDTTDLEHNTLTSIALSHRLAYASEIDLYNAQVIIEPPNPDIVRATELLATSPQVITQPEMWELMRIFGRLLGINA